MNDNVEYNQLKLNLMMLRHYLISEHQGCHYSLDKKSSRTPDYWIGHAHAYRNVLIHVEFLLDKNNIKYAKTELIDVNKSDASTACLEGIENLKRDPMPPHIADDVIGDIFGVP